MGEVKQAGVWWTLPGTSREREGKENNLSLGQKVREKKYWKMSLITVNGEEREGSSS